MFQMRTRGEGVKQSKIFAGVIYGRLLTTCRRHFENLRVLVLGSGSGGWVTEAYAESFLLGIPKMKHLVKFSLLYDCTENILQARHSERNESCYGSDFVWIRSRLHHRPIGSGAKSKLHPATHSELESQIHR